MNTAFAFLGLGFAELLVLGFVALLVFGGRLPEVMRNLGRTYAKFRHGMSDLTNPIRDEMRRLDVTPPRPAPGSKATDLPPPDTDPPPTYDPDPADSLNQPAEVAESPTTQPEGDAGTPDPEIEKKTTTRPSRGGAADEPPPV